MTYINHFVNMPTERCALASVPKEYQELGRYVREVRRSLGATQAYIAARVDVTESYICQVERGKTRVSERVLQKLETALELRSGALFVRIGKPPFDLVKTLLEPAPPRTDPLTDIDPAEREELTRYLSFLRVQQRLRQLSS